MTEKIRVMVFNATFNNISVILWRSVLLLEENRRTQRKPPTRRKSLTNCITSCCIAWVIFEITTLVVIFTDCIGSCKSNYHATTPTTDNINMYNKKTVQYTSVWFFSIFHRLITLWLNKGNNKITELRTIL